MSQKVINIKRAKINRTKPLLSMSSKELNDTFHALGGSIFEGMLEEARATHQIVKLMCVVLSRDGVQDRVVSAFEEYGDEEHVALCEETTERLRPFLHSSERLRVATFEVDLERAERFELPSKKLWRDRENDIEGARDAWRSYGALYDARGAVTVVVTWLKCATDRRVLTWNVDHGDGAAMYQHAQDTIAGLRWNKLLTKKEKLEAVAYRLPFDALSPVWWR